MTETPAHAKVPAQMLKNLAQETSTEELARLFKVLSVETRLRMMRLLMGRSMCVGALARALGITDAAVSQHLRVLRDAQLVHARKSGYFVHYSLNTDTLDQWREAIDALLEVTSEPACCDTTHADGRKEVCHGEERLSEAGSTELHA